MPDVPPRTPGVPGSSRSPAYPPLSWMAGLRWPIVARVLLQEPPGSSVLELGCGEGAAGARLAARFHDYVGVEPDASSARVARERVAPVGGRVVHDLAEIGDRRPADVLCAFEVLEHVEDDGAVLREWLGHAAPGARLVFSVPADPHRYSTTDRLVGHYRRYTDEALRALLEGAGVTDVTLRRYAFPLGYVLEDVRDLIARRRLAGTADRSMEHRSHGSGRLLQPRAAWQEPVRRALLAPFRLLQDAAPGRGPCLVAWGRAPR